MHYPKEFGSSSREVFLVGEAYFDVARNEEKQFIIHTETIDIRVLGTSFNVSYNKEQTQLDVTVEHGKVAVGKPEEFDAQGAVTILSANQKLSIEKNTGKKAIVNIAPVKDIAWTKKELIFRNEALGEIIRVLSKWYGVKFVFAQKGFNNCRYTGNFDSDATLDEVLNLFSISSDLTFKKSGKSIILSGKPCSTENNKPM